MDTTHYRKKYAKQKRGNHEAYPPGGADVMRLCDAVDALVLLINETKASIPPDAKLAHVERTLFMLDAW